MSTDKIEALDQALAEIFSKPHLISTKIEPSLPDFDRAALAGIFSEPLPILNNTEPSSPRFDHQALAEIFGEPPPTDPQPSPLSIDEELSPPLFGKIRDGEPVASIVAAAPSTNAESARPQRAESLLAKIRYIFSTKAETLPSNPEIGTSSASPSGQLHEPEPVTKAIAAASPADPEIALSQQEKELLTEASPLCFEQEASSPCPSDQPGKFRQAVIAVAVNSPTDTKNARLRRVRPFLVATPSPVLTNIEPPPSIPEKEPPSPTAAGGLDNVTPGAKAVSVTAQVDEESTQQAEALPTEFRGHILDSPELASVVENGPSRLSDQLTELEPAVQTVEAVPQADAARPHNARSLLIEPPPPTSTTEPSIPQRATFLLAELPVNISADAKSLLPILEEEQPPLILVTQLDRVEPAVRAAAVAAPNDLESALPWQAKSLQAERLLDISKKLKPSLEETPSQPIFHGRHDDVDLRAAAISTASSMGDTVTREPQAKPLLARLELDTAIRLRWVMRDIRANRTATSPTSEDDLATLVRLGLVEMREKLPSLTALGILELN